MALEKIKEQLRALINETNNEILLEDILMEAETRINSKELFIAEGISKEDYEELISLVNEPPEKDTIAFKDLKSSLSRWIIK